MRKGSGHVPACLGPGLCWGGSAALVAAGCGAAERRCLRFLSEPCLRTPIYAPPPTLQVLLRARPTVSKDDLQIFEKYTAEVGTTPPGCSGRLAGWLGPSWQWWEQAAAAASHRCLAAPLAGPSDPADPSPPSSSCPSPAVRRGGLVRWSSRAADRWAPPLLQEAHAARAQAAPPPHPYLSASESPPPLSLTLYLLLCSQSPCILYFRPLLQPPAAQL